MKREFCTGLFLLYVCNNMYVCNDLFTKTTWQMRVDCNLHTKLTAFYCCVYRRDMRHVEEK